MKDPGALLAWAREEVFAFVLYYKQRTRENAKERVAVWTRELIEAAVGAGGTYYLPYQPHATSNQLCRAYPRVEELFALKRRLDPEFRFRNVLWDKYYAPTLRAEGNATSRHDTDEAIYREIQEGLSSIKPFLADLFYALPSLGKQKREMARQTLELLGGRREIEGYVEIGTTGRYLSHLREHLKIRGPVVLVNDLAPTSSPVDILERGGLGKPFRFVSMEDYRPIRADAVSDARCDLVTCFIGLHHIQPGGLDGFVRSIARILRPGGLFILRDHDVPTPEMNALVSLAHTVFNAGLGMRWEVNAKEPRFFAPLAHWCRALAAVGLADTGARLLQANGPTGNTLMSFVKA